MTVVSVDEVNDIVTNGLKAGGKEPAEMRDYIGQNSVFSQNAVRALRTIKYCAIALIEFILGAEAYFFLGQASMGEDIACGVTMGLFFIFISVIIATAATVFEKILQNAVDMKSENDVTI